MYDINSNILQKSGITVEQLDAAMRDIRPDYGLRPALEAIVQAEHKHGINAIFVAAHASTETGWGKSQICVLKNNLFGFNAIDSNPGRADSYTSQAESVRLYADFLAENYLNPQGRYFNGPTPSGIMKRYASAGDKAAATIVNIMNMIAERAKISGEPAPNGFPTNKEPITPQNENKEAEAEPNIETEKEDEQPEPAGKPATDGKKKKPAGK